MTEEQKENFEKVIAMLHNCEGSLQHLYEILESLKHKPESSGSITLDNVTYHQFKLAWIQCISNMARASNNLHFLRRDFEPQTIWLANYMERVKNNPTGI